MVLLCLSFVDCWHLGDVVSPDEFQLLLWQRDVLTFALMLLGALCGGLVLATPQRIRRVYCAFLIVALVIVAFIATHAGLVIVQ